MTWLARLIDFLRRPWRTLSRNAIAQPVRFVRLTAEAIDAAVRGDW